MFRVLFRRIGCALLAILLLCLCGCGLNQEEKQATEAVQAEMDELLVKFMTCIENGDAEGACALAYGPEQMQEEFLPIANYWPARSTDPYEASGLTASVNQDQDYSEYRAVYLVKTGGEDYQVILVNRHDWNGEGITSLYAVRMRELIDSGSMPEATGRPIEGKTAGQWGFTAIWILSCLLCVLAIIHIIRVRPEMYGLWLLIVLPFVGVFVFKYPGGAQTSFRLGLFTSSKWIRYQNGMGFFQVCLPIGAIIYWCRYLNYLLKRRKERRASRRSSRHRHSGHHRHSGSHHRHSGSTHHSHSRPAQDAGSLQDAGSKKDPGPATDEVPAQSGDEA